MEIVALILAVVALVVAVLAHRRAGGLRDVRGEIASLSSGLDSLRGKTADALSRLQRALRPSEKGPGEGAA
jgi:hypothetical protein